MKRENRYVVLKREDLRDALTEAERKTLEDLCEKVSAAREHRGKAPLVGVFVESDWPEFEPTWSAIERRVTNAAA